ncbi:MAG TPA: O-antigen ligase family protein [Candidatus Portnoybacteria bacterium]|nr:O-antigen ligase family protein [Candidatus Portnoybacteria bacterium]
MKPAFLSKIDSRILKLLKLLLGACLTAPLLMSAAFIFPYTSPKAFAFRILVELAAVFYLYLALKYPDLCPARSLVLWAVSAFLFVSLAAMFFGKDAYASFWGSLERMGGVWSLIHFSAWFFMLIGVFKTQQDWRNLLKVSVGVSSLISLLAIGQHFFSLGNLLPQVGRVYATLGNAGVLGSYLIFNIFLAGYLFFESSGWQKWLAAFGVAFLIIGLLLTGTRGAYLGLAVGAVAGLFLAVFFGEKKIKKYSAIFLAAIFILAGILFISRDLSFVQNNAVLSRLTSFSVLDATTQSRLLLWQGAWRAWQDKPWLGFGPENFELAASKYLSPKLISLEAYDADRAHNFIFDYGVATGWLGLMGYLAMISAAGERLIKGIKNNFYFSAIFVSLLAAYLAQNLFIFDSFASYLMLFFVLALVNNFCHPESSAGGEGSLNFAKKIVLAIFAFFIVFSLYSFNLKPLLAASYANQILSLPASEAEGAAPLLGSVIALKTFALPEIAYQATLDYIDKIGQNPTLAQNEKFYGIASSALNELVTRFPGRVKNYIALSWLDLYFSGFNSQRVEEAISLGDKIKEMSPNKKDAYFVLVASYALIVQPQKAQEVISQAEKIDAKIGEEVKNYYDKLK